MSRARSSPARKGSLADTLFTRTRQRVLGVLFGQTGRSFYASELIRLAGTGSGAAQRELARLERGGLVTGRRVGQQKHCQANPKLPLYSELRSIVLKTVGLAEPIREALDSLSHRIRAAFIFGSVSKGDDRVDSDIDLLVVSDSLTYGEVFEALESASRTLGRQVNPSVYSAAELTRRARAKNAFVTRVLAQPKVWIIGNDEGLPA